MDTRLDAGNATSKKVVHKTSNTAEIADAVNKSNDDNTVKQELVEEIIIPLEKKRRDIKQIEKSIIKMEHSKISELLNDSTVSKIVTKKWVERNNLSSDQYSVNTNIRFKTTL